MGIISLECSYTELPVLCPIFFSEKVKVFLLGAWLFVYFWYFHFVCGCFSCVWCGIWLGFLGGDSRSGEVGACFKNVEEGRECKAIVPYFLLFNHFPLTLMTMNCICFSTSHFSRVPIHPFVIHFSSFCCIWISISS